MKRFILIPAICVMVISCNSNSEKGKEDTKSCSKESSEMQSNPSDWKITANVKKALVGDSSLSAHARMISVTTNQGEVTLKGTVASSEESRKVVRMVKDVEGVKGVDNQLKVSEEGCSNG